MSWEDAAENEHEENENALDNFMMHSQFDQGADPYRLDELQNDDLVDRLGMRMPDRGRRILARPTMDESDTCHLLRERFK